MNNRTEFDKMTIKVEIKRLMNDAIKKIRAFADVVIDDSIVIHSVSVVEGEKGMFVSMPRTTWTDKSGEKRRLSEYRYRLCHLVC